MNDVDKRVVQMQFDNQQFEQNISKSLSSLDRLEKGLENLSKKNNALNNLERSANRFSLDSIGNAVESISRRFSTMGIAGMTAIQNITNKAISIGSRLTHAISSPIIEGGKRRAMNIKDAKFQIKGLLENEKAFAKEWPKLEDDINYGVKDTAYGFDEAAKAASQFMASGVKSGEEMKRSLRGISGVAAMTNTSYSEIARVFTRISGSGRVFAIDLNSLAARGLNAAATLGKALNKTEAEVRDMVSHGEIDFATFAKAMDDAYGEHAKEANETFAGSLANMKAAMARIGAVLADPMYDSMRDLFNTITPVINLIKGALEPILIRVGKAFDNFISHVNHVIRYFTNDVMPGLKTGLTPAQKIKNIIDNLATAFFNLRRFAKEIIGPIHEAFRDIIPRPTLVGTMHLTERFAKLTKTFRINSETADKLRRIFKGVFAVFDMAKIIIGNVIGLFTKLWKSSKETRGGFLDVLAGIGDFLVGLDQAMKKSSLLITIFKTLHNAGRIILGLFNTIGNKFKALFSGLSSGANSFEKSAFAKFIELLGAAAKAVSDFMKVLGDKLLNNDALKDSTSLLNQFASAGVVAAFLSFKKSISKGGSLIEKLLSPITSVTKGLDKISGSLTGFFDTLGRTVKSFGQKVQTEALFNIAKAIAVLTASLFVLSLIDEKSLYAGITAIGVMLGELAAFMQSFSKAFTGAKSALDVPAIVAASGALVSMATSILIMAGALKMLSSLSWNQLKRGMSSVAGLIALLTVVLKVLSSKNQKSVMKGSSALIMMAFALRIMTKTVMELSELSWEELGKGVSSVVALIAALTAFVKISAGSKKMVSIGLSMVIMGAAMKILVSAAKDFASMSWEDLGKAGAAIIGLMAAMTAITKLTQTSSSFFGAKSGKNGIAQWNKTKNSMLKVATSMVIMGAAFKIIANAAKDFSNISWEGLAKAGLSITVILAEVIAFSKQIHAKQLLAASIGTTVLSAAFLIFSQAIAKIATFDLLGILAALVAIRSILASISAFVDAVESPKKLFALSVSTIVFGTALQKLISSVVAIAGIDVFNLAKAILAISILLEIVYDFAAKMNDMGKVILAVGSIGALGFAVKTLSTIGWLGLVLAIGSLAAIFTVLGVAAKALKNSIPTIEKLAFAMLKFSVSMLAIGFSALTFGTGLILIGAGISALVAAGEGAAKVLGPLTEAISENAPKIAEAIFNMIFSILDEIPLLFPKLRAIIISFVTEALNTLSDLFPKVVSFMGQFVHDILPAFGEYIPDLVNTLLAFIETVLDILIEKVPIIVTKVVTLIRVIFRAVIDAMGDIDPQVFTNGILAFGALVTIFVIMAKVKKMAKDAIVTGIVMIAVFGLLTVMFLVLNYIDADKMLIIAGSLAGSLIALASCLAIVSFIPAAGAISGLAALAAFIGGMIVILSVLGGLKQIPGLQWLIDEGGEMLESIGRAIGKFVGGIIGGIAEGVTSGLPGMADNLSMFMVKLQPFIIGAKMLDPKIMTGVKALANTILILTASEVLDGLAGWITGGSNLSDFGTEMVKLAPSLVAFARITSKIKGNSVRRAASCGLMVAKMAAALPNHGGIAEWFGGEKQTLADFGKELAAFGPSFMLFALGVMGFNHGAYAAVKRVASAVGALGDSSNGLPDYDGVAQWFGGGKQHLSEFADELKSFGPSFIDFAKDVSSFGATHLTAVQNVASAVGALGDSSNGLPDYDGLAQWIGGGKAHLSSFGEELAEFGPNFADFADSISEIPVDIDTKTTTIANAIAALVSIIPENEAKSMFGVFSQSFGEASSYKTFTNQLTVVAGGVLGIYKAFKTAKLLDNTELDKLDKISGIIVSISNAIKDMGDVKKGSEDFKGVINALAEANIQGFVDAFNSLLNDENQTIALTNLQKVGENIMLAIATGLITESDALSARAGKAGLSLVTNLENGLKDTHTSYMVSIGWYEQVHDNFAKTERQIFKQTGINCGNAIKHGLDSRKDIYKAALDNYVNLTKGFSGEDVTYFTTFGSTIMDNLVAGLKKKRKHYKAAVIGWLRHRNNEFINLEGDKFETFGKNIIQKISDGFTANKDAYTTDFKNAFGDVMTAATGFNLGVGVWDSIINGMIDHKITAVTSLKQLVDDTVTMLDFKSIGKTIVTDILSGIDSDDLTITPVLDLSNIRSESAKIGGILSGNQLGLNGYSTKYSISYIPGKEEYGPEVYDDTAILEKIQGVVDEVSTLGDKVDGMQVVLDSGAAIGALAPGLDRALGSITTHKGRGI